jgi:tetratricopeptide (TPR) repeat protein
MDLFDNPFYRLKLGLSATRADISSASDECLLTNTVDSTGQASDWLTHPAKRLVAELAWLPELPPDSCQAWLTRFKRNPKHMLFESARLGPLSRCNLLAAMFSRWLKPQAAELSLAITQIARGQEEIDPEFLWKTLNEERELAGLPLISKVDLLNAPLRDRQQFYLDSVCKALSKVAVPAEILQTLIEQDQVSNFIDELVDRFLHQQEVAIQSMATAWIVTIDREIANISSPSTNTRKTTSIENLPKHSLAPLKPTLKLQSSQLRHYGKRKSPETICTLINKIRDFSLALIKQPSTVDDALIPACWLDRYFSGYPETANAWFDIGYQLMAVGENEQAIQAYQACLNADPEKSFAWNNLGVAYERTLKFTDAVEAYRKDAERGNAQAQSNLGWMYRNGKGVVQDDIQAVNWYRKAAEQGNAQAECNLGWMYEVGRGVEKNYEESIAWYRKSAENGYATAQSNLGLMYQYARGVVQDNLRAVYWYRKAAEQGHARAEYNLGWMYENGKGVVQDTVQARSWYRKAAEQGDVDAIKRLEM